MSAGSTSSLSQVSSPDQSSPSSYTGSALAGESVNQTSLSISNSGPASAGLTSLIGVVKKRGKGRPPGSKNLPKPLPGAPPPPRKKRGRPKKLVPLGPDGLPLPSPPRRARGRPRRDPNLPQPPKRSRVRARSSIPTVSSGGEECGTTSEGANVNTRMTPEKTDTAETRILFDEPTGGWGPVEAPLDLASAQDMPRYELNSQTVKVGESGTTGSFYQLANQPNPQPLPHIQPTDSFEAFEFPDFPFSFDFPAFLQEIQQYRRTQDNHQPTDDVEDHSGHSLLPSTNPSSLTHGDLSSSTSVPPAPLLPPDASSSSSHILSHLESHSQQAQDDSIIRTRHRLSPEPPLMSEIEPAPLADSFAFDMPAFLLEIQQYHRDHFQGKEDDGVDGDGRW